MKKSVFKISSIKFRVSELEKGQLMRRFLMPSRSRNNEKDIL